MPANHLKQWRHNRAFIGAVEPEFPDWAVTATFYTALHAVDALLKHDNVQGVTSHEGRNRTLTLTSRYSQIWKKYQPLYDLSRTIRYLANPLKWVPWEKVESEILRRYLYPLEASVRKLMGQTESLPPVAMKASSPAEAGFSAEPDASQE